MQSKIIEYKGKNIYSEYYQLNGERPTLVFLHDSLGCVQLWRDFPQKLAEITQCNLFLYDRIGYGKSAAMETSERDINYLELEADILGDLLKSENIKNAIFIGHSDGGSIALLAAAKYPENVKAVIVEAAHIFVETVTLEGIREAIQAYETTNLAERLAKYHGDKVDVLFEAWTETWTSEAYRNWNVESFLPHIVAPILFIQGEKDEYGTLLQVEKTLNQVKGKKEQFLIPQVGHTPHKECPDLILERMSQFVNAIID